jgi:hypothetical protein
MTPTPGQRGSQAGTSPQLLRQRDVDSSKGSVGRQKIKAAGSGLAHRLDGRHFAGQQGAQSRRVTPLPPVERPCRIGLLVRIDEERLQPGLRQADGDGHGRRRCADTTLQRNNRDSWRGQAALPVIIGRTVQRLELLPIQKVGWPAFRPLRMLECWNARGLSFWPLRTPDGTQSGLCERWHARGLDAWHSGVLDDRHLRTFGIERGSAV